MFLHEFHQILSPVTLVFRNAFLSSEHDDIKLVNIPDKLLWEFLKGL